MYATCVAPPRLADTRTRSTSSPSAYTGPPPLDAVSVKLAEALITLGSFVGIVTLAEAVEEARFPLRVALVELLLPTCPFAVTVTVVPTGMLAPAMVTATGLVVPAGSVMSGEANDPLGAAGAATPATCVIASVGGLVRVTVVGCVITDGCTPLKLTAAVFVNASTRTRPKPPTPSQPVPPAAPRASIAPLPVIVVATSRTAPPLPPPPPSGPPFGAPPAPPFARIEIGRASCRER